MKSPKFHKDIKLFSPYAKCLCIGFISLRIEGGRKLSRLH